MQLLIGDRTTNIRIESVLITTRLTSSRYVVLLPSLGTDLRRAYFDCHQRFLAAGSTRTRFQ